MAEISTGAALATAAVVVAGVGVGAYFVAKRRCACRIKSNPATWRRVAVVSEPPEGYDTRWERLRDQALERCQADPVVVTFPQAVRCALSVAFPEGQPWRDPDMWSPWMTDAAAIVRLDLAQAMSRDGRAPRGWEVRVWLRGAQTYKQYLDAGYDPEDAGHIAAQALYPRADWSSPKPWQRQLVTALQEAG